MYGKPAPADLVYGHPAIKKFLAAISCRNDDFLQELDEDLVVPPLEQLQGANRILVISCCPAMRLDEVRC
jgi:hypothetical protein